MPFVLIVIGLYVVVVAIRGYISDLGKLLAGDLVGKGSFGFWLVAMLAVGMLGYVGGGARVLSRALLVLILVVIVLANGGVWNKLVAALQSPPAALPVQSVNIAGASGGGAATGGSGGGGAGGLLSSLGSIAGLASLF